MRVAFGTILTLGAILCSAQLCKADTITTQTTTTTPGVIVTPSLAPASVIMTTPAPAPLTLITPEPSEVSKRTVILQESRRAPDSTSSAEITLGPMPNPALRLARMLDQIQLGVQRGMISPAQAAQLMAEHANLVAQERQVRTMGFPQDLNDDLEKRLNVFNVQISQTLTEGAKTAGIGTFQ